MITVLLMLSILAMLIAVVANDSSQTLRSVSQSGRDTQAKYAAYAGLEIALNHLRQDSQFVGTEIRARHGRFRGTLDGLEKFQYDVYIWNNIPEDDFSRTLDDIPDLVGPDDVVVRPDTVYMVSSGTNLERGEEVILSSVAGTARRVRPVFDDAAFARSKLSLRGDGGLVDAWNSHGGSNKYVTGSFPGSTGGGSGGGGTSSPTVEDYQATLGTDSAEGRTLRLLEGAKLNGHYRVGPSVDSDRAFGVDSGSSSGSALRGGASTVQHFVSTANNPDAQIAGVQDTSVGAPAISETKAVIDSKETEVPHFVAPYTDDDCQTPPILNNKWTTQKDKDGKVVKDWKGDPKRNEPAPVGLNPGGYTHIDVPKDQTLVLSPGVYYFRDELNVNGGKIKTTGGGPSIVFCGKKAIFRDAQVNMEGSTNNLQLCFTDGEKEPTELARAVSSLRNVLRDGSNGVMSDEAAANLLSPLISRSDPSRGRRGFSYLEVSGSSDIMGSLSGRNLVGKMNGGQIYGSIMANIIDGNNAKIHQDLSLKGANLMNAGGWKLEGVHQIR